MTLVDIMKAVDETKIIDFLEDLIRTPSTSGEEQAISEIVAKRMESIGLDVEVVGGNVVGRIGETSEGKTLVLNGHLDHVPPGDIGKWDHDPFTPVIFEGSIYGRGSADMKGGLAAMIMSIDALKKAKVQLSGELIVTSVIMEEVGMKLSERKGTIELIDKGIIKGDAAIICEPTNLDIGHGHRSKTDIEITVRGRSVHACEPERGINAIANMAKIIVALDRLPLGYDKILGRGSMNIGTIEGGTESNVVPEVCKAVIDRRLTIGESPESARIEIEAMIKKLVLDSDVKTEVKTVWGWLPTLISTTEPIVQAVAKAAKQVIQTEPKFIVWPAGTDGHYIHHLTKMPFAIFGPGDCALAHTSNEHVEVRQVIDATKITAVAVANFLGTR